jgi:hypothetical protein
VTVTRQAGFSRLAAEYVAMQAAPRTPGAFSELYVRGFEAAVEVASDRREEGRTISWVRLAYDRAVADVEWMEEGPGMMTRGREATIATLLVFEWGVAGVGDWVLQNFGDDDENEPDFLNFGRLGDVIGHQEDDGRVSYWRLWPDGWERWMYAS